MSKPAAGEIEDIIKSLYPEKKAQAVVTQEVKPKEEVKQPVKKDDDDYDDDFDI